MTTAQLNAEIMQNLSVLADSEDMMTRVAKYLRKLVKEKKADPTLMSKEEFFAKLDKAEESIEQGKGKTWEIRDAVIKGHPDAVRAVMDKFTEFNVIENVDDIKGVGHRIVQGGEYFSKTSTSVFEMSSLVADFRDKFMTALQDEKVFSTMGIKVSTLTVDGFHANEEDLELIRNRINA